MQFPVLNVKSLYASSKMFTQTKRYSCDSLWRRHRPQFGCSVFFVLFSCKMHASSRTSYRSKMHSHAVSVTTDVKKWTGRIKKISNNNIRHTSVTRDCTNFTSSSHKHECTTTCDIELHFSWDVVETGTQAERKKKEQILSFMLVWNNKQHKRFEWTFLFLKIWLRGQCTNIMAHTVIPFLRGGESPQLQN